MLTIRGKNALPGLCGLLCLCALNPPASATGAGAYPAAGYAQDAYIIRFKDSLDAGELAARIAAAGGTLTETLGGAGIAVARLDARGADALGKSAGVAEVLPDVAMAVERQSRLLESALRTAPASSGDPTTAFTYPWAWNLRTVHADLAWQAGYLGDPGIRVAMLDTGIDPYYPDLQPLIDATASASFCSNEAALNASVHPGYPAWTDLYGHGTWTASIVASRGEAVAAMTTRTTLMAVQVLGWTPCPLSATLHGIAFAANQGADVINLSLGIPVGLPKNQGWGHYAEIVHQVVQYALDRGVSAVVVSAGNESRDLDHDGNSFAFLCGVPGVLCVSATGPTTAGPDGVSGPWDDPDQIAWYTNYGASAISVAAPGGNLALDAQGNVISAAFVWGACAGTDIDYSTGVPLPGQCSGGGYDLAGGIGTSAAAPHVAALAALLVGRYGHGSKGQVSATIRNSADDLGRPGVDPFTGAGRINVARALGVE